MAPVSFAHTNQPPQLQRDQPQQQPTAKSKKSKRAIKMKLASIIEDKVLVNKIGEICLAISKVERMASLRIDDSK